MYKRYGEDYVFVATEPMEQERKDMGWELNFKYPFELRPYENNESRKKALQLAIDSDVVIIGSAPEFYITERMKNGNKLTFRYSERIYKRGKWRAISPRGMYYRYKTYFRYINKRLYMLCASAYAAGDFAILGSYLGRCYKWGYFPEFKQYDIENLFLKKNNSTQKLLWAGRLIDWKHPEQVIMVARKLKEEGYNFTLDIIGTGELESHLKSLIQKYNLSDRVNMLGSMKPEDVRTCMETSNIYLFTSDYSEGWGAVLNESMNSGCAVVASHAIGSVPFLIKHGYNGLIYKNNCIDDLYKQVQKLMNNNKLCIELGENAYNTVKEEWNAEVAATRLINLFTSKLNNNEIYLETGPCSIAEPINKKPEVAISKSNE